MTDFKHAMLLRDLVREGQPVVVGPSHRPSPLDPKYTTIIGTSGSTDYLLDTTGNQRFWPIRVPRGEPALDGQGCDGLHDKSAPGQYLCSGHSGGFPDLRGDLVESQDDAYDEARRDADEEMR